MFPFIVFNPYLCHGRGDGIRRCSKCGEPITRVGKLLDRHPSLIVPSILAPALASALFIASFASWTIDRDFHKPDADTYAHYLLHECRQVRDLVSHLW